MHNPFVITNIKRFSIFICVGFFASFTQNPVTKCGNKARRFTKIRYEDPEDKDTIERAYISTKHPANRILRNLICNVEFVAILPSVLQVNADSHVMDSELNRALQEHLRLEQRLEMLEEQNLVSDGKNETPQLKKNIKTSFRNLLILLKAHPLLVSAWKKELGKEIGKCERALIKELHALGGLEPTPQQDAPKALPISSELKVNVVVQDFPAAIEEVTTKVRSMKLRELKPAQT